MEWADYLRFVVALVFVLAAIGGLAWVVRRLGLAGSAAGPRGKRRRLGVTEVLPIDAKQRLVLVSRDDVEHLLLLGPGGATTIETGIPRASFPKTAALAHATLDSQRLGQSSGHEPARGPGHGEAE